MKQSLPSAHSDPAIEVTRPYITSVAQALIDRGFIIHSWLDPRNPRDATIQLHSGVKGSKTSTSSSVPDALVWEEETGWRYGFFVSGEQGVRTVLDLARPLGGGLLPSGNEVVNRILSGARGDLQRVRSFSDRRDGFDDLLRGVGGRILVGA